MQDADIYLKTEAGRDEIKSRARGLPMATRAILLMVDGQRNVAALRSVIAGTKAPGDTLETLEAQGLISARRAADVAALAFAPAFAPIAMPPPSISTPRIATMGQVPNRAPVPDAAASTPPRVPDKPAAPPPFSYDGPLDLALPTFIHVDEEPAARAADDAAFEPPLDVPPIMAGGTSAQRYEHLYTMMNEVVRDFLPAHRRYFIQLKIERCSTPDELLDLLDALRSALAKARGDGFASEVISRLRSAAA